MLPLPQAMRLLQHCEETTQYVSQILVELGGRYETTITLIKELSARGLMQTTLEKNGVGRPRRLVRTTPLGRQFIEHYNELSNIRLHSNHNDVKKAVKQGEEARRLVELGVDPYVRLQEVNEIARNIASSAKTGKHP